MNKMMHYAVLALAATALQARAQEATPAPAAEPAQAAAAPTVSAPAPIVVQGTPAETKVEPGEVVKEVPVERRIKQIMREKDWETKNTGADGKTFYITSAIANVDAPVDSPTYNSSRMIAFDKAMLKAKEQMVKTLSMEISQSLQLSIERPPQESEAAIAESLPDTSLTAKLKQLIAAKLDNALRAEGVDPQKDAPEKVKEAKKKLLQRQSFSKLIEASATSAIAGLTCHIAIEGRDNTDKVGQIGVIARLSPLTQEMALSIRTHQPVKQGKGKRMSISKQLPEEDEDLLSVFGVKTMFDKEGNPTLVAFAQAGAKKEDPFFAEVARREADLQARAMIASFAGEAIALSEHALTAETAEGFVDGSVTVEDAGAYKVRIEATTKKLNIRGISTLYTWSCKHPLSGRMVYGSVVTWSPKSAQMAVKMKEEIEAPKFTPEEQKAAEQTSATKPAPAESPLKQTRPSLEEKPKPTADRYYAESFESEEL